MSATAIMKLCRSDPLIDFRPSLSPEPVLLAPLQKCLDLLLAQFLCFQHADDHSSASPPASGPSCVRISLPFRPVLYWTRVSTSPDSANGVNLVVATLRINFE